MCDCIKSIKPQEDQADHLFDKTCFSVKQMLTLRLRQQFLAECQN